MIWGKLRLTPLAPNLLLPFNPMEGTEAKLFLEDARAILRASVDLGTA